jgi:hypothetical protein
MSDEAAIKEKPTYLSDFTAQRLSLKVSEASRFALFRTVSKAGRFAYFTL